MKKSFSAFTILLLLLISGCNISETVDGKPWLNKLIDQIKSEQVTNPPSSIWKYEYKGRIVYFRPQICCDQYSYLYDEHGNVIGCPDGGFTGFGDGRCQDFFSERTNGILIWMDKRTR
jgi:hypothetical protein